MRIQPLKFIESQPFDSCFYQEKHSPSFLAGLLLQRIRIECCELTNEGLFVHLPLKTQHWSRPGFHNAGDEIDYASGLTESEMTVAGSRTGTCLSATYAIPRSYLYQLGWVGSCSSIGKRGHSLWEDLLIPRASSIEKFPITSITTFIVI